MKHLPKLGFAAIFSVSAGALAGCTTSDVNEAVGVAANVAGAVVGTYSTALDVCERYHNGCYVGNDGRIYYYSGNVATRFNPKKALQQARRNAQLERNQPHTMRN